jgi:membrane protein DedA with SNARE-associated domain
VSSADLLLGLEQYGIVIVPALVVAEQFGIPVPAVPALLGVGALVAHGRGSLVSTLSTIAIAALVIDFGWYELGRRRGARVLAALCRFSVEPDSCARKAHRVFARYGIWTMLVAKFVPGLTTILPPMAGIAAVNRMRFVLYEIAGVLLWAGLWIGVGYMFSDAVAPVATRVAALGMSLGLVVGAVLAAYIVIKYLRRKLYFRPHLLRQRRTVMRTAIGVLLASVMLVASACATTPAAPPSVNVTGKWAGTWTYENPSLGYGILIGSFQQDGSKLNGNFDVTGPVINHAANNIIGSVSGDTIRLSEPTTGDLTVNGNEITGWMNGLNPVKLTLKKQ